MDQENQISFSTCQYWGLGGGENYLHKNINVFSSALNLNFKLSKIKGPIQVLANTLEKHNYIN
jgi:hypothetical protein